MSLDPERDFIFPTGRAWAEDLRYPPELANVPDTAVESFAGVANPWELGRLSPGERVLDLGSGAPGPALSTFEDTRRKAQKYGARDTTPEASTSPERDGTGIAAAARLVNRQPLRSASGLSA